MSASFALSARGSLTLPRDVREQLGLKPGHRFVAVPKGAVVMLVPVEDVAALRGTARGADTSTYRDKSEA